MLTVQQSRCFACLPQRVRRTLGAPVVPGVSAHTWRTCAFSRVQELPRTRGAPVVPGVSAHTWRTCVSEVFQELPRTPGAHERFGRCPRKVSAGIMLYFRSCMYPHERLYYTSTCFITSQLCINRYPRVYFKCNLLYYRSFMYCQSFTFVVQHNMCVLPAMYVLSDMNVCSAHQ